MKVPFVNLGLQYQSIRNQIINKFDELSKKGEYILGKELENFENDFSKYCGTKFAIGVGNGSDALTLSLRAIELETQNEVIMPGNSFIATAWTVANLGAKPVFIDVQEDFNINPSLIEKAINKNTKAIIPVHLTGRMADMLQINDIAKKHNLHIIEDAAQAIGASLGLKKAGSFGITGCFSLHPLKNLHVHGDGGVITTNDDKIYNIVKKLRNHGLKNRDTSELWGYNSRLDNIQAAIAKIKLAYLDGWNKKFNEIANIYSNELKNIVKVPKDEKNKVSIYHRYMIQHPNRDKLKKFLEENGIETKINYPIPLHLQKAASGLGYKIGDLPNVEKQSKLILSLPIYAELEYNQINYVIENIKKFNKIF